MIATTYKIRAYQDQDRIELTKIMQQLIPQYFHYNEMADFVHYLNSEIDQYFVVEDHNHIIGSGGINLFPNERLAKISWDMIHPIAQGKGVGSSLMKHRLDLLLSNPQIDTIQVRTSQLAFEFYQKHGFKTKQVIPNYWSKGYDLYDMHYE